MKMNVEANRLVEYVNFVDTTKKQNTYFENFFYLVLSYIRFYFISYLNN